MEMLQASEYLNNMAASNRRHFTTQQAVNELGGSVDSVRTQIRQLNQTGEIATPFRSFHVVVPPEFRNFVCVPSSFFIGQLMEHLNEPYYIGLLSTAARYGASHQMPQIFQVMVKKKHPAINCGRARIRFLTRKNLARMPTRLINTLHGKLRYSTPEGTALELLGFPLQSSGMNNVATILVNLAESMDPEELPNTAKLFPVCWVQRLGYLLELLGEHQLAESLFSHVDEHAKNFAPLAHCISTKDGEYVAKWKLIVNTEVAPDL